MTFLPRLALVLLPIACWLVQTPPSRAQQAETHVDGTGVNHQIFDALLKKHVHGKGVDYAGVRDDMGELQDYLAELGTATVDGASRKEKLALYINAYNAFTLRLVARHYPDIESIRDIPNPWGSEQWVVAGQTLSLDQIEHGILRGELQEPRIHFAVNCASISCPPLQPYAFLPDRIDKQLNAVTREFLRSDAVQLSVRKGLLGRKKYLLTVSRIFKWFGEDFQPSVPEFIARHTDPRTAETIRQNLKRISLKFQDYDWGLNDYMR